MIVSSSFTKCACGCFGDSTVNNTVAVEKEMVVAPRKRRNTASTVSSTENEKLEVDPALSMADSTAFMDSSTTEPPTAGKNTFRMSPEESTKPLVYTSLPSGLSVESEDYLVDELTNGDNYYATLTRPSRMPSAVPCGDI
jgi:hypothetical protein